MVRRFVRALGPCVALWVLAGPARSTAAGPKDHGYIEIHRSGAKTLPELFSAEVSAARSAKKQVVVMFSADWCSPCKVIKTFLAESPAVRRKVSRGRLLVIDVDEWRGPAHRLIPGVNPTKLPTVVRVDHAGKKVQQCYGTDLGLLSGEAVGDNLARMIDGKLPTLPKYESDPELKTALIRQQAQRDKAQYEGIPPVEVAVRAVKGSSWTVRVVLRNAEAPRRWFLLPEGFDQPLAEAFAATGWDLLKFDEHVRAQHIHFRGTPGAWAIPVAGHGYVVLDNWVLQGPPRGGELPVWELNRLTIDGKQAEFDRKLPYELRLDHATRSHPLRRVDTPTRVEAAPRTRHAIPLDPI